MRDPREKPANGRAEDASSENPEPNASESSTASQPAEPGGKPQSGWIVGIGASGGGLEAFSELLRNLPANTGMTFVLVEHLDPRHETTLVELLGNCAQMPVIQLTDAARVEPDRVYLIPPNATMVHLDGTLRVSPPARQLSHRPKPIDQFFVSLAETVHNRAIGVILSGAASDGTLGLKAIKTEGGITFAQDSTAGFDGMPRNAIAADVVDFILPPKRIAEELARLARHPAAAGLEKLEADSQTMEKILAVVRGAAGVDFRLYKQASVQRRVARRMALKTTHTLEEYLDLLEREPEEANALAQDLLIKVTGFFRDPAEFEVLRNRVFRALARHRANNEPVRLWVPGCSTGEEVYSIAISLLEFLERESPSTPVLMFGTDASENAIAKARSGVYGENEVSAVGQERLRKFFTRCDSGYRINRNIREMCVFSRHILGADPPLSRMDLISCRNLLIYFAPALQQRAIDTLAYALRPGGFLLVGRSENTDRLSRYFHAVDEHSKIFTKRLDLEPRALNPFTDMTWHPVSEAPRLPASSRSRDPGSAVHSFVDHLLLSRYGPSGVVVDKNLKIVEYRGDMSTYLHTQPGEADLSLLDTIREDLSIHLRTAISEAHKRNSTVRLDEIQVRRDRGFHFVRITIIPISIPSADQYSVILFEDLPDSLERARPPSTVPPPAEVKAPGLADPERRIEHLERELASSRDYLQSIIEELRSTNEEAQSVNEELQSSNEELQTTKEELHASIEKLAAMNIEMQSRHVQLITLNDDLLNLLSSINTPIVMVSNELCIRRFTPAAEKLLHLITSDVGRPVSDIRPGINVPNMAGIFKDVLDNLKVQEQEVQGVDGRDYLMRIRPYRTATNRIDGAVLVLIDITDLKRGIEETRRARDYAAAIVDTMREPLLVLDENLVARSANRALYEFFNSVPERVEVRGVYDIVDRQLDLPPVRQLLERLLKGESPLRDIEIEHDFQTAGSRVLLLNARRVSADGSILLAFEDITERKRAAEARYRRLFESARDGIVIIDEPTGEILDINPYVEHLFGYPRRDLVGRKLWEIEPAQDTPGLQMMLEQARDQRAVRVPDAHFKTKDGRAVQAETIASLYHEGSRRAIQLNIRDLTDRRKFERELQETQRLESLGLLAGGIAHDFNNLLTGIMGTASLITGELRADDPWRIEIESILSASERAADLTRQLLAYAGQGRFVTEQVDLSGTVRDVVVLLKSSIPKTVDLKLDLAEHMPAVEADPGQMQQLIMNLVINAGEAIGEGSPGSIGIRTGQRELTAGDIRDSFVSEPVKPGLHVWLEVKDTGMGMSEATKARIFDPFFTTKFTGRGLGLAAVAGILRALGGAIRVYSTPGTGSSFYVLLPAIAAAQRPARAKPAPKLAMGSGTILVVDDEDGVRRTLRAILRKRGFEVLLAHNGRAGADVLRDQGERVSLVILDLTMPVMGGEQTFDLMRAIRKDVPIVLMSGYDETEALVKTAGKDFTGFLQKPFTMDRLIHVVAAALGLKEHA